MRVSRISAALQTVDRPWTRAPTGASDTLRKAHLMLDHATLSDSEPVADLVAAARAGSQDAWVTLIRRYQPAVDSVARRFRLAPADAEDVSQEVWLRLATHLTAVRTPEALPGWISTTAARCAIEVLKARRRSVVVDPAVLARADQGTDGGHSVNCAEAPSVESRLLRAEERLAVRQGLDHLRPGRRDLLLLLVAEPRLTYQEIHEQLGVPVGSIGPTRARGLDELRRAPSVRAWMDSPGADDVAATLVA